ncbi:MAG: M15 family metallopeptidase, partial [Rhodospirillales bacterium]|nr:M15 family metallopeptidase [Rhodospirillales bacterium]
DVLFQQRLFKTARLYPGALDGVWGPLTDRAAGAFAMAGEDLACRFGRFDARSERQIATLQIAAQRSARVFLARTRATGLDARVISATRSYGEQNHLFRRGRYGRPGPKVTNARGGQSNHNFAIAWDIGLFEGGAYLTGTAAYERAARAGLIDELEWGGTWRTFRDTPHYQLANGLSIPATRALFEAGEPYF